MSIGIYQIFSLNLIKMCWDSRDRFFSFINEMILRSFWFFFVHLIRFVELSGFYTIEKIAIENCSNSWFLKILWNNCDDVKRIKDELLSRLATWDNADVHLHRYNNNFSALNCVAKIFLEIFWQVCIIIPMTIF